jgi:hypothetical protein
MVDAAPRLASRNKWRREWTALMFSFMVTSRRSSPRCIIRRHVGRIVTPARRAFSAAPASSIRRSRQSRATMDDRGVLEAHVRDYEACLSSRRRCRLSRPSRLFSLTGCAECPLTGGMWPPSISASQLGLLERVLPAMFQIRLFVVGKQIDDVLPQPSGRSQGLGTIAA